MPLFKCAHACGVKCKYCLNHLHAIHMLLLAPRKREGNFPSEAAQHVRSLRVFPCNDTKVKFTRPERRLSESQSGWSVCTERVSFSLSVCMYVWRRTGSLQDVVSLLVTVTYEFCRWMHAPSLSLLRVTALRCPSLLLRTSKHAKTVMPILTSVCSLLLHQSLASHQPSLQNPFATILSK